MNVTSFEMIDNDLKTTIVNNKKNKEKNKKNFKVIKIMKSQPLNLKMMWSSMQDRFN